MAEATPLSAVLTANTVKAAALAAVGKGVADGFITASALALAKEAMAGMVWMKQVIVAVGVIGLALGGVGWAEYAASPAESNQHPKARVTQPQALVRAAVAGASGTEPHVDRHGDPLPDHTIQRIGTARFRPGGLVYACAFSSDGKYLLISTENQGVVLFNMADGRCVRRYGDYGTHAACAFSPDGTSVAASMHGSIQRWNVSTGQELHGIDTPQQQIWCFAFTPDGKRIISGGEDKILRLSDTATGEELAKFEGHEREIRSVAVTPNGRFALSSSSDMTVRLWNLATGKMEREFTGRKPVPPGNNLEYVTLALSRDGKWLATSDGKPGVCIFKVATGKLECRLPYEKQDFYSLAFSHDGKMVAAGTATRQFLIWDRTTRALKEHRRVWPSTSFRGRHWGGIPSVAFSPDDTRVAFAEDSRVALWDIAKGQDLEPADISAGFVHYLRFARQPIAGDGE